MTCPRLLPPLPSLRALGLLTVLACSLPALSPTNAPAATLNQRIGAAVAQSGIGATTSVSVYNATTQRVVYTHRSTRWLAPASNQKLLVAAAALHAFGPSYRFRTDLKLRGTQTGTVFTGDVHLVGGGDPTLSTNTFARNYAGRAGRLEPLVTELYREGVRTVKGRLVVDETFLDTQRYVAAWPSTYRFDEATALGALTVNQSYLGSRLTGPSARHPAVRAGQVYIAIANGVGIRFTGGIVVGKTPSFARLIGTSWSPPVSEIVKFMNTTSDNFTAEILLKDLGRVIGGPGRGTTVAGAAVTRSRLTTMGMRTDGLRIVDGSGLSAANRITSGHVAMLLNIVDRNNALRGAFISSLAVSGVSGTLRDRLRTRPYKSRVRGKTGTLRVASALSGYVLRINNERYGFSVMTYSAGGVNTTAARGLQDRVAMILVK